MSSQLWKVVYQTIQSVNRSIARTGRCPVHSDTVILAMYFWSVGHDRPLCWAAERSNYTSVYRPRRLPSRSQFCRRIKSLRCQTMLDEVFRRLAKCDENDDQCITMMDGRGFRVHSHSKDTDATRGYASGGMARGYKLHAIAGRNGRFQRIRVTGLNVSEKRVAKEFIEAHPGGGLLLADSNYDSGELYDLAAQRGLMLMTPLPENAGGGHRPQSEARMFVKKLWEMGGEIIYAMRKEIERFFGQLSAFGGGLAPLPAWVRTLERVQRWITAKVIIYHARLTARTEQT